MPLNVSTASSLLLVLLLILCPTHGQNVEEECEVDDIPNSGICKRLQNCPIIYQQLLAGKLPKKTCGYIQYEPIVCCPKNRSTSKPPSTPEPEPEPETETTRTNIIRPLTLLNKTRGAVAREKCAEAAKAVYAWKIPPTFGDRTPVNVSLCALKTRKLIVGGKKAEPKEFPHMTAIGFDNPENGGIAWNCGGTLISSKVVLTAAHCLWTLNWGEPTWVRVGDLNLAQDSDNARPQTIRISERIKHPEYKYPSEYHDIAILRLENEVTYDAWVRPACLPIDPPDVGSDNKAVATGWGLIDADDEVGSENLLKVTLNLVTHTYCNASFSDSVKLASGIMDESQICAGEVGKDTCQGDSGGPLAVFNTDHECMYNVIGVTSLGSICGSIAPGVYTRVSHYIPWIERTAWPEYF